MFDLASCSYDGCLAKGFDPVRTAEAGQPLVVPLWHKTQAATRSHSQTVTARIPDGPRADEIVVIAAASTGPRPHARIGDRVTDPAVTSHILEGASL